MPRDRVEVATASRGSSSDEIHDLFVNVAQELGLGGDLLDFGAGAGRLSERMVATGRFRDITAIDLVAYPGRTRAAVRWIRADLNGPIPLRSASMDVVVAAEVIEHLENPRAVAREWARILRPGGFVLASTPNNESIRSLASLIFRGHHVAFTETSYPAHITALMRMDLERVLEEAGFRRPSFRYSSRGAVPGLTGLDWGRLSLGLLRGAKRFSDNMLAVATKP